MTADEALSLATEMCKALKMFVEAKLTGLATRHGERLATLETRTGALSLQLVRSTRDPEQLAEFEALLERVRTLDKLEARIKALEARPVTMGYEGVWREGVGYERGAMVTHSGSLWHCNAATVMRPGSSDAWQLAVKRGKDGKDAR